MTIHDHFSGSAHCVECGGHCRLVGEDAALTRLVRFTMEYFCYNHKGWLPPAISEGLNELLGERWAGFHQRAIKETPPRPERSGESERIRCMNCGKSVSSPVPKGTVVRAYVECPECIEKRGAVGPPPGMYEPR